MSKFVRVDAELLQRMIDAVRQCWDEGSPVAGPSAERWEEMARIAIRRIRSFARRKVPDNDRDAQIRDIADRFVEQLQLDPKMVGPLIVDYRFVAERSLDAVRAYQGETA